MKIAALHVITSFYLPAQEERRSEITLSLRKNLESPNIHTIYLFVDDHAALEYLEQEHKDHPKIKIVRIGKQPLISEMLVLANLLVGKLCMIINADIWLHSISDMALFEKMENKLFGITRYESNMVGCLIDRYDQGPGYVGSQDAFIFQSPVKLEIIAKTGFAQNVWGSDNVILREFQNAGYKLFNPCRQIITVHEHKSEVRNDNRQRLPPPWVMLKPCVIDTALAMRPEASDILSLEESNQYIINKIKENKPFYISRLGIGAETRLTYNILKSKKLDTGYIPMLTNNAGIYFNLNNVNELLVHYAKSYNEGIKNSDAMACFESSIKEEQDFFCETHKLDKIHNRSIEPFYIMSDGKEPWTMHLKGKKVLIVHPFIDSIKQQISSGFKLFGDKHLFHPDQEYVFYKTFNTICGNRAHNHWLETYTIMCGEIQKLQFDIALVACGGYGLPICDFIKTKLNRSAIYVGGGLQLFFGVFGKRWQNNNFWKSHVFKYKTTFIRPSGDEIVENNERVEGGTYW